MNANSPKTSLFSFGSVALAALIGFSAFDADQERESPPVEQEQAESAPTLHDSMEALADNLDRIGTLLQAEEPDVAAATELAATVRTSLLASIEQPPRLRGSDDATEQLAYRIGFQRKLVQVLDDALGLELALGTNDLDGARTLVETLFAHERPGHQEFKRRAEKSRKRGR